MPVEAMGDVAAVLSEHEITNSITGVDDEHSVMFIEVEYEKEEKQAIHDVEDIIDEYNDEDKRENGREEE